MDIFVGVRLPNPYGREDLAPTRSPTSCFYQTHVTVEKNKRFSRTHGRKSGKLAGTVILDYDFLDWFSETVKD